MKLRVKYTAQLRAAIQRNEEVVELPDGSALSELLIELGQRHESGRSHLMSESGQIRGSLMVVVNELAVSPGDAAAIRLNDDDVVLLLPPIAGG